MNNKPLIILTGPTAVGKTSLSIKLAKEINGEIISADSMQVYKHMDIGTAKITTTEMSGITHYLVDELEPEEEFNVVVFQKMAKAALNTIYNKGKIPIVVGGTGFYIQALLKDIDFSNEESNDYTYRKELSEYVKLHGEAALHHKLELVDEESARAIHANNIKRVIRALEYYHITGEKISTHNEREKEKLPDFNYLYFVLEMNRDILYQRINQRVDIMVADGLYHEVQKLKERGCHKGMVSMEGIGYKQVLSYLEGEMIYEESIEKIKKDSRHFAKRQMTWFRREPDVTMLHKDEDTDEDELLQKMIQMMKERNIIS